MPAARNLLFIDVETTGLDPRYNELIEVAAVKTTPDGHTELEHYEAKVRPCFLKRAHPEALEVNGFNEEEWRPEKCSPTDLVVSAMHCLTKDVTLVGQNVSFDENFMTVLYEKHNREPNWDHHKIDVVNLSWPLVSTGKIEKPNLKHVAGFLGLSLGDQKHRAMADVQFTRLVYLSLIGYYQNHLNAPPQK